MKKGNAKKQKGTKNLNREIKRSVKSSQSQLPFTDIKRGIIFSSPNYYTILQIFPINFAILPLEMQKDIVTKLVQVTKQLPDKIKLTVVAKRSTEKEFIERINEKKEEETSVGCQILMQDRINLITASSSTNSITKRFYLTVQYVPDNYDEFLHRQESFEEVYAGFEKQINTIRNALLSLCGLRSKSFLDDTSEIQRILYEIASPIQSDKWKFSQREDAVMGDYLSRQKSKSLLDLGNEIPALNFIAPQYIKDETPSYLVVDDTYISSFYLPPRSFPNALPLGWLCGMTNYFPNAVYTLIAEKKSTERTQSYIEQRAKMIDGSTMRAASYSTEAQTSNYILFSATMLQRQMAEGQNIYDIGLLFTLYASSKEELKSFKRKLTERFREIMAPLQSMKFRQLDAYKATFPVCKINPRIWKQMCRNASSLTLSASFPFASTENKDTHGVYLGKSGINEEAVFIDLFGQDDENRGNHNATITGSSGAGKTFFMTVLTTGLRLQGHAVYIIAPLKGKEFIRPCEGVDGEFVQFDMSSEKIINIFDIKSYTEDKKTYDILAPKITQVQIFLTYFTQNNAGFTNKEISILQDAIIECYRKRGIHRNEPTSIYQDEMLHLKQMPTFTDLYEEIVNYGEDAEQLKDLLKRFVDGDCKSYNGQTNFDLHNLYTVFDVTEITQNASDEHIGATMFLLFNLIQSKILENTMFSVLAIDEVWQMLKNPLAAKHIERFSRAIRGMGGSLITATQEMNDFVNKDQTSAEYGGKIFSNSDTNFFLQTTPTDMDSLVKILTINEKEKRTIQALQPHGPCYFRSKSGGVGNNFLFTVCASESERRLIEESAKLQKGQQKS